MIQTVIGFGLSLYAAKIRNTQNGHNPHGPLVCC